MAVKCQLHLPASGELQVTLRGRLRLPALLAVSFRSLEVLTTASIRMDPSGPMFLQEDTAIREVGGNIKEPSKPVCFDLDQACVLLPAQVQVKHKKNTKKRKCLEEKGKLVNK